MNVDTCHVLRQILRGESFCNDVEVFALNIFRRRTAKWFIFIHRLSQINPLPRSTFDIPCLVFELADTVLSSAFLSWISSAREVVP